MIIICEPGLRIVWAVRVRLFPARNVLFQSATNIFFLLFTRSCDKHLFTETILTYSKSVFSHLLNFRLNS